MKKFFLFVSLLFGLQTTAFGTTLMEIYQQALTSDQLFQEALNQRLSTKEGVPISLSTLLPAANIVALPSLSRTTVSGSGSSVIGPNTQRGYDVTLTVTQTLFNFSQFANFAGARALSKEADALLNAAMQDLMLRVARAYFAILNDEDNLLYISATKDAYAKQLDQVTQQYNVGLKTITDVYTAQSSYDSSSANYITAQNQLEKDKENLRVITGHLYSHLAKLSESFPLVSPNPADMEAWAATSARQNWSIKAAQYAATAACQTVKQQFGGHLPTLQFQGTYDSNFIHTMSSTPLGAADIEGDSSTLAVKGSSRTNTASAGLVLSIPLVQGGAVVASTRQAQYNYQVARAQLDQTMRNALNLARQSYLGVMADIRKVQADKLTIKSTQSSLEGLRAAYQVGTETLVNVLQQQQKVVLAQQQYAASRYSYINNLLALKAAAGTLSFRDLQAIDSWLIADRKEQCKKISCIRHSC